MPARRICAKPGCPEITAARLCQTHRSEAERQRGSREARGYDPAHRKERKRRLAQYLPSDPCVKCGLPLGNDPAEIDLGHTADRTAWTGLEHARQCNRADGGRRAHAQ